MLSKWSLFGSLPVRRCKRNSPVAAANQTKKNCTVVAPKEDTIPMNHLRTAIALSALFVFTVPAQRVPQTKPEVAHPGGKVPNAPKLALVKVADGFNDPTNVASPNDGSG